MQNGDTVSHGQIGTIKDAGMGESAGRLAILFEGNKANIPCALDEFEPLPQSMAQEVQSVDAISPLGKSFYLPVLGVALLLGIQRCCQAPAQAAGAAAEAPKDEAPAPAASAAAPSATVALVPAANVAAEAAEEEAPAPDLSDAAAASAAAAAQVMDRMTIGLSPDAQASDAASPTPLFWVFLDRLHDPLPSFMESMEPLIADRNSPPFERWVGSMHDYARRAKEGVLRGDALNVKQITALMAYTNENPNIYRDMNNKCYIPDRSQIEPYTSYILLLLDALQRLPCYTGNQIFRGVKMDLRADYQDDHRRFTWHGFISATKRLEVLSEPLFCGDSGPRTIFAIELTQGQARDISPYSMTRGEDEILLPPGSTFEVISSLPQGDLTIVQLREVESTEWIRDLRDP